jgi:hypothetical protein
MFNPLILTKSDAQRRGVVWFATRVYDRKAAPSKTTTNERLADAQAASDPATRAGRRASCAAAVPTDGIRKTMKESYCRLRAP